MGALPAPMKTERDDDLMRRRLVMYRETHPNPDVRKACDEIIKYIDLQTARTIAPKNLYIEARAMQEAIAKRLNGDPRSGLEIMEEVKKLLADDLIF